MATRRPLRAIIIGLGSIGRRHLENLRSIEPDARITVWRRRSKPTDAKEAPQADQFVYRLEDALDSKPDVALITSPAPSHIETGLALADAGAHLFIEKPVADTLDRVDELLDLCRRRALVLMVGYNLRFHEPLLVVRQALMEERIGRVMAIRAEVGQYLPDWRPGSDYREAVSARRDLGGGVVLELSHELDYVRWLAGEAETVSAQTARLSDLEIDVEDTAEIILRFKSGVLGSLHLDIVQRSPRRACWITGTEGTLAWDGLSNEVRLFSAASNRWADLFPAQPVDRNEMYIAELRHFLNCVKVNSAPLVSGEDGRRVLELALAVKRSSAEQRVIAV